MIVTGMLAWWNEPVETLTACVESLSVICDRLLVVDGGFELWPGATPTSPPRQRDAVREAAVRAGLELDLRPGRLWAGQVEKRDYMIQQAAPVSDWVLPVDADWTLHGNRGQVRAELAATYADELVVGFFTPWDANSDLASAASTTWHAEMAGLTVQIPLVFRALDDMHVEQHHWQYSGVKDGKRYSLCSDHSGYPHVESHPLTEPFLIMHHCLSRDEEHVARNREFCAKRDLQVSMVGAEA